MRESALTMTATTTSLGVEPWDQIPLDLMMARAGEEIGPIVSLVQHKKPHLERKYLLYVLNWVGVLLK